ncbi:MAG: sugar phosphate nucleotidyltransferase, partial [bacterium]|nr:sugar phosphate nucleotidyltransferase [bacterium]
KHPLISYLQRPRALEKLLEERGQKEQLAQLLSMQELLEGLSVSFVVDSKIMGDGYAVLQAKKHVGDEPFLVAYPDDVVEAKTPCALQLMNIFRTSQRSVQALVTLPQEKLSSYGVIDGDRIASKLWKVKSIVEKPPLGKAPSSLAVLGRRILTPDIFSYLKKTSTNGKGEIVLTEAMGKMAKEGKPIYGYEIEGRWWECGDMQSWLVSNAVFSLRHPLYGKIVKDAVKQEKIL